MSEAAVPESVTIAAVPERARLACACVAAVLGESHPHNDLAVLLASKLVTNSVLHSGSAVPGGLVTVAVAVGGGGLRVEAVELRKLLLTPGSSPSSRARAKYRG
jgi:hypothetical protein